MGSNILMVMKRIFISLLLLVGLSCEAQIAPTTGVAGRGPGGSDTSVPGVNITTDAESPVVGITGSTSVTYTFTFTKPVINFVTGDITPNNATVTGFTTVSPSVYTALINPSSNGIFGAQVLANKCTDFRGTNNTASNNLELTFSDASGFTYNLQLATITKSQHYRGHIASFNETSDAASAVNLGSGEMFCLRKNFGATMMSNANSPLLNQAYKFGRLDVGVYPNSFADFLVRDPLVTASRDGNPSTVGGYKNGVTSYSTDLIPYLLVCRNNVNLGATSYATGQTATQLISRSISLRWDGYVKQTTADFAYGTWEQGQALMASIIPSVISSGGWYTGFHHWGNFEEDYAPQYFALLNDLIGAADVYRGTMNTIAEYYFVKESITSVTGSGSLVTINYTTATYPTSPWSRIRTPIWIRFDLSTTGYAGLGITTSHGGKIRSVGGNVYYISVPLDFNQTSASFNIYVTPSPNYLDFTAANINRSGNTITSDVPVRIALFSKLKSQPYEISTVLLERFLTDATSFTLATTLNTVTTDYYVGWVKYSNGEMVTSGVYQF